MASGVWCGVVCREVDFKAGKEKNAWISHGWMDEWVHVDVDSSRTKKTTNGLRDGGLRGYRSNI